MLRASIALSAARRRVPSAAGPPTGACLRFRFGNEIRTQDVTSGSGAPVGGRQKRTVRGNTRPQLRSVLLTTGRGCVPAIDSCSYRWLLSATVVTWQARLTVAVRSEAATRGRNVDRPPPGRELASCPPAAIARGAPKSAKSHLLSRIHLPDLEYLLESFQHC